MGIVTEKTKYILANKVREFQEKINICKSGIVATKLFSTNASVNRFNCMELSKLPSNQITFIAIDSGKYY